MLPSTDTHEFAIRPVQPQDAEAVAQLSTQLGYPAETSVIEERIRKLTVSSDRITLVACFSDAVVGWIEVAVSQHLATGAFGEITGLIIGSEHRSRGIGRDLVHEAERWVNAQGVSRMTVRSRTTREAAHRFYLREGYAMVKTSAVFSKELDG